MKQVPQTPVGTIEISRLDGPAALDALERRLDQQEPRIHALVDEPDRRSRLAHALENCADGPLRQVPIGIKDIFHVDGFETRAGARVPATALGGEEAESVARLRRAGGLILGKTVTTEFAYFAPGPTRNPVAIDHTPGGSSSGSAAAVAAGYCPLALGTQTIGSICRPASYCGVTGFKPSYGRISTTGVIPLSPSFDHVGLFTRNVADAAVAAGVLCRNWRPTGIDRRPRLAVPLGPYLERASSAGRALFDQICDTLERQGWEIDRTSAFADFEIIERRHQTILAAEAARVHADWFARFGDLYHPRTRELVERGQAIGDRELAEARIACKSFAAHLDQEMLAAGIDLWISPAATGTAPLGLSSTGDPVMNLPWTQAGLPAISLPAVEDDAGLPFGLQVVGRPETDEILLHWASALEAALAAKP